MRRLRPSLRRAGVTVVDGSAPAPDTPTGPQKEIAPRRSAPTDVSHVEFAIFYEAEMPRLVRYLVKCGISEHDAQEAAQHAFEELFKQWDSVRSPKAWLRTVAFRMLHKAHVKNERLLGGYDQPGALRTSARIELREEADAVLSALLQLPMAQRQVFALYYDGFETCEIADILEMTEAAVRQNRARARARLSVLLRAT
jgi:RNA polymerase sigma factor (sigma-70 family)